MKKIQLSFALAAALSGSTQAEQFCSLTGGFCVNSPLTPIPIDAGSIRTFASKDGTATLTVFSYSNSGTEFKKYYDTSLRDNGGNVTYRIFKNSYFVISGKNPSFTNRIFYTRARLSSDGKRFIVSRLDYRKGDKRFDNLAGKMDSLVRFLPVGEAQAISSRMRISQADQLEVNEYSNQYGVKFTNLGDGVFATLNKKANSTDFIMMQPSKNLICSATIPVTGYAIYSHGPFGDFGEYNVTVNDSDGFYIWGFKMGTNGNCRLVR